MRISYPDGVITSLSLHLSRNLSGRPLTYLTLTRRYTADRKFGLEDSAKPRFTFFCERNVAQFSFSQQFENTITAQSSLQFADNIVKHLYREDRFRLTEARTIRLRARAKMTMLELIHRDDPKTFGSPHMNVRSISIGYLLIQSSPIETVRHSWPE